MHKYCRKHRLLAFIAVILLMAGTAFAMTFGDDITFENNTTFQGTEAHSGTETHSGTVTFSGTTTMGTVSSATISGGSVSATTSLLGGTNAQLLLSNGTLFQKKSMSGDATITNAGVVTVGKVDNKSVDFADVTDAKIQVANGVLWDAVSMSGDATMTNAGVISIGSNKVGTAETFVNTITVTVAGSGTSGTGTVTSGSTIIGYYPFANVSDSTTDIANKVSISSTTLTVKLIGAATEALQYKVVVLEP